MCGFARYTYRDKHDHEKNIFTRILQHTLARSTLILPEPTARCQLVTDGRALILLAARFFHLGFERRAREKFVEPFQCVNRKYIRTETVCLSVYLCNASRGCELRAKFEMNDDVARENELANANCLSVDLHERANVCYKYRSYLDKQNDIRRKTFLNRARESLRRPRYY